MTYDFARETEAQLPALFGMAMQLTRDQGDAEDLVQDTVVKALNKSDYFEPNSNLRAWLFKILTNTFFSKLKKDKNRNRVAKDLVASEHYEHFLSMASVTSSGGEWATVQSLDAERVRDAVNSLSEEFRLPVLLCDLYDFSYKEISEILDCPMGTVMSRLFRARRKLQEALRPHVVASGLVELDTSDKVADLTLYRAQKAR